MSGLPSRPNAEGDYAPENMVPRFLVAKDAMGRDFVLHLKYPKLLFRIHEDKAPTWVFIDDDEAGFNAMMETNGQNPKDAMASIMREVSEFLDACAEGFDGPQ